MSDRSTICSAEAGWSSLLLRTACISAQNIIVHSMHLSTIHYCAQHASQHKTLLCTACISAQYTIVHSMHLSTTPSAQNSFVCSICPRFWHTFLCWHCGRRTYSVSACRSRHANLNCLHRISKIGGTHRQYNMNAGLKSIGSHVPKSSTLIEEWNTTRSVTDINEIFWKDNTCPAHT